MKFTLPDQLPATVAELDALAAQANKEIAVLQARHNAGEVLSTDDADRLEYLIDSRDKVDAERATVAAADQAHTDKLAGLFDRANPKPPVDDQQSADTGDSPAGVDEAAAAAEVVAEAEAATAEAAEPAAVTAAAPAAPARPFKSAVNSDIPGDATPTGVAKGWEFVPSAPRYAEFGSEKVGALEIAQSITSVRSGQSTGVSKTGTRMMGGREFATQTIAKLARPAKSGPEITTAQELLAEIDRVTAHVPGHGKVSAQALVAAGGWQAPSEQVYTFCGVPQAVNLVSLPEPDAPLARGGVRFPVESDMSALLTDFAFQFHFTETELEAVDGNDDPTAVKNWSEIPGVDQFLEFRLGVIGYAVKVGILHQQGWPEAVAHDIERLMVRHQHGISWRTINEMVAGSGAVKVVPTSSVIGATSSILNGLAWQAINLRLDKGLDVDAPIEGIAPVWLKEVIRSDLALRDGLDSLEVDDSRINGFLTRRNIYLQYVDDWQTRSAGKPGHLDSLTPPDFSDVLLYPAGTWFRHLNPVISFGVQYPMELLKFNQYSHAFFEDAIAVGKRCDKSIRVRLPLCVNGAVGAREEITCSYSAAVLTKTVVVTITGAPTGGTIKLKFSVNDIASGTIAHNAAAATVDTTLTGIDDAVTAAGDITVTGDAGGPWTVTYPASLGDLELDTNSLTGGSDPDVEIA